MENSSTFTITEDKTIIEARCPKYGLDVVIEHSILQDNGYHMMFTDYDNSVCATAWFASKHEISTYSEQLMDMVSASYYAKHAKHWDMPHFKLYENQIVMELFGRIYKSIEEYPSREVMRSHLDELLSREFPASASLVI